MLLHISWAAWRLEALLFCTLSVVSEGQINFKVVLVKFSGTGCIHFSQDHGSTHHPGMMHITLTVMNLFGDLAKM